jgi:hypothetical protein
MATFKEFMQKLPVRLGPKPFSLALHFLLNTAWNYGLTQAGE